jgi:hypothetical protein
MAIFLLDSCAYLAGDANASAKLLNLKTHSERFSPLTWEKSEIEILLNG